MKSSMREALERAGERPVDSADQGVKRRYAELLSHALADVLCRDLAKRHKHFVGIKPGETRAGSARGTKKIDANLSSPEYGLLLGVSIKTISHRDKKGKGRYTKNRKRVDEEFLAEAMDYHVRQPYAVLIGLYFLPIDACDDAKGSTPSSFGAWVEKLFSRAGRRLPTDNPELFERIFIGLFDTDGDIRFFDVEVPPPKQGRPPADQLWSWERMLDEIHAEYARRNARFRWADAPAVPLTPSEADAEATDADDLADDDGD
jgi:hypothetical protein